MEIWEVPLVCDEDPEKDCHVDDREYGQSLQRNLDRPDSVLAAIDYFHRNPVRRGLVEKSVDWQWSSARWYEGLSYDSEIRWPKLEKLPAEFLVPAAR